MAANRRLQLLLGGLVAAIAVAIWWWSAPGGAAPAAAGAQAERRAGPQKETGNGAVVDVNLEALAAERAAPEEGGRNPFRFQASRPAATAVPAPATSDLLPPGPVVPAGPPPPPPIALKFIGIVEKGTTKFAILSGTGYTLHGKEGDSIDGRYRILRIGVESIEIAYLDGRGRQTIRLTGQ